MAAAETVGRDAEAGCRIMSMNVLSPGGDGDSRIFRWKSSIPIRNAEKIDTKSPTLPPQTAMLVVA